MRFSTQLFAPMQDTIVRERYRLLECLTKLSVRHPYIVYRATDLQTQQTVLIKHANREKVLQQEQWQETQEILFRECLLLQRLPPHHQFPEVLDTFSDENQFNLVLSFFPGNPLDALFNTLCHNKSVPCFSQEHILAFGIAVCQLLEHLHTLDPAIIHRDVKPANIITCIDGSYALIDFGNAREYGSRSFQPIHWWPDGSDTYPGIGSPGYAPPEQYVMKGFPSATSPVSDLYSLGAILHQMITGLNPSQKLPFEQFLFLPLDSYVQAETISSPFAYLVAQLLEQEPARRPQSAHEVRERMTDMQNLFLRRRTSSSLTHAVP